jgi:Protein of unknown function (DUF1566)
MRHTVALLALASTLALACKGKDNTKIVVAVWSDLAVPAELDSIRIDVAGTGSKNFPLTAGSDPSAPLAQLELVPQGSKNETFTVTATGLYGPTALVAQTASVSFVAGQSLLLKLFLAGACEGAPCTGDYTCAAGFCNQPIAIPNLPPYTGGIIGTGDAGTGGAVAAGDWAGWPMPNDQVDVTAGAPNLESYTDNGDGTVTDNVTGLMWQQAVSATTYTWADAVAYCPTLTLAGHSDWRLPSRIELVSIVDLGVTSGSGAPINATYFPSMPASGGFRFWTSSPSADSSSRAWYVDFAFGSTDNLDVSNTCNVRCVR